MSSVLREEKKFLLSIDEALRLAHRLGGVMAADPHNGTHGYIVRSLYFDTVYDRDFYEKLSGAELRRKIRLRCYDPGADFAMLEIDKRMKILLDNWGFVPVGRAGSSKQEPTPPEPKIPPKQEYDGIDGEREALPG